MRAERLRSGHHADLQQMHLLQNRTDFARASAISLIEVFMPFIVQQYLMLLYISLDFIQFGGIESPILT